MSVFDELTSTEKIRSHEEHLMRYILIIAITGHYNDGNPKKYSTWQYIETDINGVLYLSLNYDHIVLMINKYI